MRRAADVLRRRTDISGRVRTVRSGAAVRPVADVADPDLITALRGLLPELKPYERWTPSSRAATLTAIAADGRFLAGEIDDATRLSSPPGRPQDWPVLLGSIGAAAWRLVAPSTPDADRIALAALLRTWIGRPFARPGAWRRGRASGAALAPLCAAGGTVLTGIVPSADGPVDPERTYPFVQRADAPEPDGATDVETVSTGDDASRLGRLLDLFEEHGPLRFAEDAVAVFAGRTGVRRAVAALVLDGLPRRRNHGSDLSTNFEAHDRMLRGKPYAASKLVGEEAEELSLRLGDAGRRRVLAPRSRPTPPSCGRTAGSPPPPGGWRTPWRSSSPPAHPWTRGRRPARTRPRPGHRDRRRPGRPRLVRPRRRRPALRRRRPGLARPRPRAGGAPSSRDAPPTATASTTTRTRRSPPRWCGR
ncbi:hypothetical protein [Actinomadura sp. CNU-125]|uniref:hypothetical protein n=1 Tax=Actinomadura sp. CNU-125 TaxID=1904961 RepID=UPI0013010852|nr:hypothetical protein [Actinomadura sp. CNU-125]